MSDTEGGDEQTAATPPTQTIVLEAVSVNNGGRFSIPAPVQNRYDIDPGDVLDVAIDAGDDHEACIVADAVVTQQGRIRIPSRKRTLYDIEDGTSYYIELTPTGKRLAAE